MKYNKARTLLITKVQEKRTWLIDELESGDRNWDAQTEALKEYQEMLKASDFLAGYTNREGELIDTQQNTS